MKKIIYILMGLFVISSCSSEGEMEQYEIPEPTTGIRIISTRALNAVDDDNLASDQVINNISIFLTEPTSNAITKSYIHQYFTDTDGTCKLVTLADEPAALGQKDVYVLTNFDNTAVLDTITTISGLKSLTTPVADATNLLIASNGLCMFGNVAEYDFTAPTGSQSPVYVNRAWAKYRIRLLFPESDYTSTNNSFLIKHVAKYTSVASGITTALTEDDYYDYPSQITMSLNENGDYEGTAFVYESTEAPVLDLYIRFNDSQLAKVFTLNLPVPARNFLYDIEAEFHKQQNAAKRNGITTTHKNYSLKVTYRKKEL